MGEKPPLDLSMQHAEETLPVATSTVAYLSKQTSPYVTGSETLCFCITDSVENPSPFKLAHILDPKRHFDKILNASTIER